jgi:histidinol-phosphate aminotransferase
MWCYIETNKPMPLVPPYISSLEPYRMARSVDEIRKLYGLKKVVKLASNENPIGASPLAVAAIANSLDHLNLYPTGGLRLREILAQQFGTKVQNVIAGNGSESILANIVRTFLADDDEVLTASGTFIGMRTVAQSRGVLYRTIPLTDKHAFDLPALAAAINERTKIVYLANPNNPTGTIFTRREFDEFYRHVPERVLIILDEAYFDYAHDNPNYPDSMHYRYDNVITLRTFSKAYGLAAVRIGYAFAHEDLIGNLLKVKLPFEPSALAEAAAIAALEDREFLHRTLELNARGMRFVTGALTDLGIDFVPSEGNFIMTLWPDEKAAENFAENLLKCGVIVRCLDSFGVPNGVRIGIGSVEDNEFLVSALDRLPESCKLALCS